MHIVSYRGPGMAGGVSAALARAWECNLGTGGLWWHLAANELKTSAGAGRPAEHVANLPEAVIQGHYRFCNEFLWPLMHDLPEFATYSSEDHADYITFNQTLGWCLARAYTKDLPNEYFVQDYQMMLLPAFLKHTGMRSLLFWHIPWPKHVDQRYVPILAELVRGMLACEAIGFHCDEYARNFMNFAHLHLPECGYDEETMTVWSRESVRRRPRLAAVNENILAGTARGAGLVPQQLTRLVTAPLGIDFDHWAGLASRSQDGAFHPQLARTPFVLSVDRADYTKGVTDRIRAIDLFFEQHPEHIGRVVFAQICGRTRNGVQAFENYWTESRALYNHLTERWSTESWQPLLWIEESFTPAELAHAYRTASAMFISAVRDGLNLTAKEYVACQGMQPGVLTLSSGTGAHCELGAYSVTAEPRDAAQMAGALHEALTMSAHERIWRMALLKETVKNNSLSRWWHAFSTMMHGNTNINYIGRYQPNALRETS